MRRALRTLSTLAWAAPLLVGCRGDPSATPGAGLDEVASIAPAAARAEIRALTDRFTRAHITGDTAFLNGIFTDDARIHPPGASTVTGRDAIARLNAEYVAFGITEFREETTALYGGGDYLVEEGRYVMTYGDDPISEEGTYLNVWRRVGDDWKLQANIWNTDRPPG